VLYCALDVKGGEEGKGKVSSYTANMAGQSMVHRVKNKLPKTKKINAERNSS